VVDGADHVVVQAALGRAAEPALALLRTAHGEWRVERRTDPFLPPGPVRRARTDRTETLEAIDASGTVVASMRRDQLTLADGETLTWVGPRLWSSRCGLGGDLWVAKGLRPRRRGFRAELSGAMLAREERARLTGLAAVLTHWALTSPGGGAAADLGASIGGGLGLL
jgi:hypothetical protein